ncbi:efflux RND transporter periplasmic adaptor subunit [Aeromonas veronii]|uniref:efflux RND transporter periplasmic adaptor subunit n=1 Tax=Aeromonas veronii TaxID=654 RepID=UPI001116D3B0|nr:efflux RND transporter periplasmic adaptor subunit [Aeromonas veronii]TNI08372.1 efflux transporter periplasmic adaptor subunit [Aeromonas veronii]HDO1313434.1 efflux RND transporter periplasmic adaptor subunit [Aeromonas veronii]HDO1329015.1 efflux RND transporter periplasmic adaptor subunit [Aeromonas veronii]HDO1333419.1 efflux RND transporter periplasmic adaptor subunit [Aeromonas veronii]HDO1337412.1 efflux RND transporter periplasmic adaptor subunit [Aeromonas veronii]
MNRCVLSRGGYGLLLCLMSAGIGWGLWPSADLPVFLTAKVVRQNVEQAVQASGVLQAREQVDVGAQVTGQVVRLLVEEGQTVKQGELLAEIDPTVAQNQLMKAEAALTRASADLRMRLAMLQQARSALRRQQAMIGHESTSRAELEQAEAKFAASEADVANARTAVTSAKIDVATAQTELGYNRIVAPMDGTVLSLLTKVGQTLVSSQVVPTLLKLADLDTMTIKARISEADVIRIQSGMSVYFTLLGDPDTRYDATLRAVQLAPTNLNESGSSAGGGSQAVYYYALFDVPNAQRTLRVGMTAQVSIVQGLRTGVLTIPVTAISLRLDHDYAEVDVLKQGQPMRRRIKTGLRNDVQIEVLAGLDEGEQVLLRTEGA